TPARRRACLQPEGLRGDVAFQGGAVERGGDVLAEQHARLLDPFLKLHIFCLRAEQGADRDVQLLAGSVRTGAAEQQLDEELLLLGRKLAGVDWCVRNRRGSL